MRVADGTARESQNVVAVDLLKKVDTGNEILIADINEFLS